MKKTNKKGAGSIIKRVIGVLLILFITVVFITVLTVLFGWFKYGDNVKLIVEQAHKKVESINSETFREHEQTVLYDIHDSEMERLTPNDYEYLAYGDMNPLIPKAFIAIEDRRFESHKGIDPKALMRAGIAFVKNKGKITQGGSTITQQLVKNIFLTMDQTFSRKFEEMVIAYELEKRYSKKEIIEFYINNINYANGNYSFESASHYYFGKTSQELSLSEIAFIAAIPNNPSYYNPVKHMDHTKKRQQRILLQMKEAGFVSDSEYQEAIAETIKLDIQNREGLNVTYATSYAVHDAVEILMGKRGFIFEYDFDSNSDREIYEKKYNEMYEEMYEELRSGGYKIFTSIDLTKQSVVQNALDKGLNGFTSKNSKTGRYETQGAAVLVNNESALVEAIVGGRSQEGVTDWFNRGYQAYRQPGSSIKPLVAYTPAFESGMLASSKIEDKWIKNGPVNAQGRYYGSVTLRYATEMSLNTVAFQLVQKVSPEKALAYLKKMQFGKIVDEDNYAGIGVGGFTYGVTPLELAGGFSTLSRNGAYIKPSAIRKIENSASETIYNRKPTSVQVYESGNAYMMTDVLKGALTERHASGYGLGVDNMPSAGKTGTTNDSKDGWFSGYTPYYTAVVWVGNDTPETINRLYGATYPGGIWTDFMNKLHKGLKVKDFVEPNDIHQAYVSYSGKVSEKRVSGWKKEWVTDSYLKKMNVGVKDSENVSNNGDDENSENEYSRPIGEDYMDEKPPIKMDKTPIPSKKPVQGSNAGNLEEVIDNHQDSQPTDEPSSNSEQPIRTDDSPVVPNEENGGEDQEHDLPTDSNEEELTTTVEPNVSIIKEQEDNLEVQMDGE